MTDEEKLYTKTRQVSVKEGAFASIASGAGEAYITPYALELKASNLEIGFLSSLASFLAPLSQIIGSQLIEKYNRKTIVVVGVILQSLSWLLLIALGFIFLIYGKTDFLIPLFILSYVVYSTFGSIGGPAWFSLLGDAVPENIRGQYFSRRNKISGIVSTTATIVASIWLYYAKEWQILIPAFISLFAISAISRSISAYYLSRHYVKNTHPETNYYFSFWQFIKKAPTNNFGRFSLYIALSNFAINLAGPFFAIYLWKELAFNPIVFTLINISAGLFSLLAMPFWGKIADEYGNRELLKIGSLLLAIAPLLWLVSKNPFYLALIPQLVGGVGSAAFNLGASNFIYDAVTPDRRAICVAYYNTINGVGVLLGASLGGLVAQYLHFSFINIFLLIFLISSLARFFVYFFGLAKIKEVRTTNKTPRKNPLLYISELEPLGNLREWIFYPLRKLKNIRHKNPPKS